MSPLYKNILNRTELLSLPLSPPNSIVKIFVHRNHSFELVAGVLNIFLARSGCAAEFIYSDYDDSLTFAEPIESSAVESFAQDGGAVDIHLLWLDMSRYQFEDVTDWLKSRVSYLRRKTQGKIIVACLAASDPVGFSQADVFFVDVDEWIAPLGDKAFDERLLAFSGTRLSNQACMQIARWLGIRIIPSLFFPPLKAIVVDLDNTLHGGVLGEDGIENVTPYVTLQNFLKELKDQGILLALASKNEERDVRELFLSRSDYPLGWDDFAAYAVNWNSKAENICNIVDSFNIGMDSVLFVDDNPGELLTVSHRLSGIHTLRAETEETTLAALRWTPGLYRFQLSKEDRIRSQDIKANREREILQKELSPADYLHQLEIVLTLEVDPQQHRERMTELLNKTNQFILSYQRSSEHDVQMWLDAPDYRLITASMKDKLSDSGLIAVLVAHNDGDNNSVIVDEIVVSCRALGRGIEDGMLRAMLWELVAEEPTRQICISYKQGPRNTPGLTWLSQFAGEHLKPQGIACLNGMLSRPSFEGVTLAVIGRK